jgi:pimeloyl-[acyl-carrier protein] methyl ester esterase
MRIPRIVLLPGLHGTTTLFDRFIAAGPPSVSITAIALPAEPLTYRGLADRLAGALPDGKLVIIAESFSGPLALALAARHPVATLVFCNSFVVAPKSPALRWLPWPFLFKLPVPYFLLHRYMLGRTVDELLVREVAAEIAAAPASVLASRVKSALRVDELEAFSRCKVPVLYLRGSDDHLVPDVAWRRMAEVRPMTTSHMPGPHMLLQANPAGAWKAIVEFLARQG